jgi:hypothetical protein
VVIVQVGDKDVRYCNHDEVVELIAQSGRGLSLAVQVRLDYTHRKNRNTHVLNFFFFAQHAGQCRSDGAPG